MTGIPQEMLLQSVPTIIGTASVVAGTAVDRYIERTVHDRRADSFSQVLSGAGDRDSTAPLQNKNNVFSRFGTVALAGLAAGVIAGEAWSIDVQDLESRTPQIIVDKSGATSVRQNGEPAKTIDSVVQSLGKKFDDKEPSIIALSAGESQMTTAKDITRVRAQGSADIASGLHLATQKDSSLKDPQPIVIVSYNDVKLPEANKKVSQISVIKVGDSSADMQGVAKKTRGIYVEASSETVEKATSDVAKAINPNGDQANIKFENSLTERLAYTGFAAGIALAGVCLARRTRIVRQGEDVVMTIGGRK